MPLADDYEPGGTPSPPTPSSFFTARILDDIKDVFQQAMHIVSMFRKALMEHRDLTFSNMLIKRRTDGNWHMTVIDLSAMQLLPEFRRPNKPSLTRGKLAKPTNASALSRAVGPGDSANYTASLSNSNQRKLYQRGDFPDAYLVACNYLMRMYYGQVGCPLDSLSLPAGEVGTFPSRYAFKTVMSNNANHTCVPDFPGITALLSQTSKY